MTSFSFVIATIPPDVAISNVHLIPPSPLFHRRCGAETTRTNIYLPTVRIFDRSYTKDALTTRLEEPGINAITKYVHIKRSGPYRFYFDFIKMRLNLSLLCLTLGFLASTCSAFLFPTSSIAQKPELVHFTAAQTGTLLNIHFEVGKEGESRLSVNGLLVELHNDSVGKNNGHSKLPGVHGPSLQMPGASGPQPQYSSGVRKLNLLQPGHYTDMNGVNYLDPINGCWEIVWRDGAAAGVLVCGLDLPKDYRRNDAVLSKGRLFLSFPIWTRGGLDQKQEYKREYETIAKKLKDEHNHELEKMDATDNIFMKAWHFRHAVAAEEKHSLIPHRELSHIPLDNEIISLDDGLFLSHKGLVWSKYGSYHFGGDGAVLGSAVVSSGSIHLGSNGDLGSKKSARGMVSLPSLADNV